MATGRWLRLRGRIHEHRVDLPKRAMEHRVLVEKLCCSYENMESILVTLYPPLAC